MQKLRRMMRTYAECLGKFRPFEIFTCNGYMDKEPKKLQVILKKKSLGLKWRYRKNSYSMILWFFK